MKVSKQQLHQLIQNKIQSAGLSQQHASIVADVLVHADARGVHSHGAVRVEYYAERISKGGTNNNPHFTFEQTGPCSGVFDGDNGAGHVAAQISMEKERCCSCRCTTHRSQRRTLMVCTASCSCRYGWNIRLSIRPNGSALRRCRGVLRY